MFVNVRERPIPSLLRGYSAPVRLDSDLTDSDLLFLLAHDSDEFNRSVFANLTMCTWISILDPFKNLICCQMGGWSNLGTEIDVKSCS